MPEQNSSDVDSTDDEKNYDSDDSIPVWHPVIDYVSLSDEDATESEEPANIPGPSRPPRRSCVTRYMEREKEKRKRTVSRNRSVESAVPVKRTKPGVRRIKLTVEDIYVNSTKLAVPQFHYPIVAPDRTAYKNWKEINSPLHNKMLPIYQPINYENAIEKFRSLRRGTEIPHASTLIVGDSILTACNFEEKLDSTISVMITYPYKAIDFANSFIKKIINDADDFTFHNIVIAFGIEFICYDPDPKEATKATRDFVIELLRAFHDHFTSKPYVRFILLTIPHVNPGPGAITYIQDINYYNRKIRKFVNKYADEIKEKWNISFCLFDWEKETESCRESNVEHIQQRYQILINELRKFTSLTD